MDRDRILVVEDDRQTSEYLEAYFDWLGYEVLTTAQGSEALASCHQKIPSVILLDVALPDQNGFEVCRTLRTSSRTSQVPIIFISQRSRRNDIVAAFEIGADDYITKPFDIEELKLRVESVIRRSRREALVHPVTSLPAGELIVEKLKEIKDSPEPWLLLYFNLGTLDPIEEFLVYGSLNRHLTRLSDILQEAVATYGTANDFLGQASDYSFIVVTIPETAASICHTVTKQFNGQQPPDNRLTLLTGSVSSLDGPFTDIKQIAKRLAQQKFKPGPSGCPDDLSQTVPRPEDFDYCNQLADQVALWQAKSELAQALIEADHLTANRIPDMNKIAILFESAPEAELSTDARSKLHKQQQLCRLAVENLKALPYCIRPYQAFEPASVLTALNELLSLWPNSQISIPEAAAIAPMVKAALPKLTLQQVLFNICRWLLRSQADAGVEISPKISDETISFEFLPTHPDPLPDLERLLIAMVENEPGAIYGYLAQKAVSRYNATLTSTRERVVLHLPLAGPQRPAPNVEGNFLHQKIKEQRLFLSAQRQRPTTVDTLEKATDLVDPLAEDFLAEADAMISALNSIPEIDLQRFPWSVIERNYRIFRVALLDLRKRRPLIPGPVNLRSLLESLRPLLSHFVFNHEIVIESEIARPVINTDKMRLTQVLVNLALNGLEAMPNGGLLALKIKKVGRHFIIEVTDQGVGVPLENHHRIFDPHYTTKGRGRGAGLYHVKSYIKQLNGQIDLSSRPGEGTTFSVILPPQWEAGYF